MKRILIIQTAFIGDVILATAVVEKLHQFYPNADIDFLLRKGNESLFKAHPIINTVHIWDKKNNKYQALFSILREIRKTNYDAVINLQRFFSTGFLTVFSGAKERIGFDKNPMARFFTQPIQHKIGGNHASVHEVHRNLSLVENLTNKEFFKPKLYPSKTDFEQVKTEGDYISMSPTSVWFTKQWPAEKWINLIKKFEPSVQIFLLGAPSDRAACQKILEESDHSNIKNKAGELSLLQSAALMKNAKMNYVNDSAPMHLASSMNAPVTAIFCSTIPAFGFTPLSDQSFIAETKLTLDCRPCGLHGKKACPLEHFNCSKIEIEPMKI